jgi:hypothetical protein
MFLFRLGDRLIRNKKDIELNLVTIGAIFIMVTVPFFLAGVPLVYPFIP